MSSLYPNAWGKLRAVAGSNPLVLPLTHHCMDVATVFERLCALPGLKSKWHQIGGHQLNDEQIQRLAVIAFLHDLGKCNRGFQAKADPNARDTAGHVMEAVALLGQLNDRWPPAWSALLAEVSAWFVDEEQAVQMLLASISHHGRPVSLQDYEKWLTEPANRLHAQRWQPADGYDPMAALEELVRTARRAFPLAFSRAVPPIDAKGTAQTKIRASPHARGSTRSSQR